MRRAWWVVTLTFLLGCAGPGPVPPPAIAKVPTNEAQRCSMLLEICDVPSPSRTPLKGVGMTKDVIPILLEVASKDLATVKKAFQIFLDRGHGFQDRAGREDVGVMLRELLWNSPFPRFWQGRRIGGILAIDDKGQLHILGQFSPRPSGLRAEFIDTFDGYSKWPGRRDLRPFASQMWSRKKLDETLLHAMRAIPFENGHWKLPAPDRPSKP